MPKILWCLVCVVYTLPAFAQTNDSTTVANSFTDSVSFNATQMHIAVPTDLLRTELLPPPSLRPYSPKSYPSTDKQTLSLRSVIVPSAMIAYGAFVFSSRDLKKLNLTVRSKLWEDRKDGNGRPFRIDNFTLIAPAVAVYALNFAGVKGKNNLVDASLIYGMSHLIGQVLIVNNVKKLTDIMRPDSSNRLSFPSGHTAQAFISAEFLRREYKDVSPWYGVAGYAVAVGTGFLRMYNNKHWLNDVIAGAGVGILSTRISYWLYPKIKNTFIGKWKGNTIVAPTYQNRSFGVGMVHNF